MREVIEDCDIPSFFHEKKVVPQSLMENSGKHAIYDWNLCL